MTGKTNQLNPPQFINNQSDFEALARHLQAEDILAVDTEADSLYAYEEKVCLIQISTDKNDFIIDPLPLDDLAPLGAIFRDPAIEKIFHASEYDILILHNSYQFEFENLFDTMLAAQILGRDKLGLEPCWNSILGYA